MTSKERIRATLAHRETDRVPTTMQCVETAWKNLRDYLNVETNEEVMQHFEIDTRIMDIPPYIGPELTPFQNEQGETVYTHPFGYQYIQKWNGIEYNSCVITRPYSAITTMKNFERFEGWYNPDYFDYNAVTAFVKKYEDKAIRIGWPGPYQVFAMLYGEEAFYINMYEEPDLLKAMLDKFCSLSYEMYERMYDAANGKIDMIRCCDDYGTQISTLFSPSMWNEFFAENTKMFVEQAHRHGAYYMQHSCGAVRGILSNLVACGIDALEPVQKVPGMEADHLKEDFGKQICFQGGVDTQYILPYGTPEEVFAETTRIIRVFYNQGGYILCGSQDFEGDVPPQNIEALYEAGRQFK